RRRVVGRPARRVELVSRTAVATGFSGPGMAAARPRGYPTGVPSVARFDGADGPVGRRLGAIGAVVGMVVRQWVAAFMVAWLFLTRLPLPSRLCRWFGAHETPFFRSVPFFPWVGLVLGGLLLAADAV